MLREQDPPDALIVHTAVVENELYQTRLRSNQDPLNFGIELDNRIATLRSVIESSEEPADRPTREVFDLLAGQLTVQLDRFAEIVANDVPAFNALLQSRGQPPITCSAVSQAASTTAAAQSAQDRTARGGARVTVGRHVG